MNLQPEKPAQAHLDTLHKDRPDKLLLKLTAERNHLRNR